MVGLSRPCRQSWSGCHALAASRGRVVTAGPGVVVATDAAVLMPQSMSNPASADRTVYAAIVLLHQYHQHNNIKPGAVDVPGVISIYIQVDIKAGKVDESSRLVVQYRTS